MRIGIRSGIHGRDEAEGGGRMGAVARKEGRLGEVAGSLLGSRPSGIFAVDEPVQPTQGRCRHRLTHRQPSSTTLPSSRP
jgi:hypothetical protein